MQKATLHDDDDDAADDVDHNNNNSNSNSSNSNSNNTNNNNNNHDADDGGYMELTLDSFGASYKTSQDDGHACITSITTTTTIGMTTPTPSKDGDTVQGTSVSLAEHFLAKCHHQCGIPKVWCRFFARLLPRSCSH